jgi:hypothetical protein
MCKPLLCVFYFSSVLRAVVVDLEFQRRQVKKDGGLFVLYGILGDLFSRTEGIIPGRADGLWFLRWEIDFGKKGQ